MTTSRDETRRLREAFASLGGVSSGGRDCPDPDRLWLAARGELEPTQSRDIVDHTASCPSCAEDWRLARELGETTALSADGRAAGDRRPAIWGLVAAAAALVLVLVGLPFLRRDATAPAETVRAGETQAQIRSLVEEDASLNREDFVLRWTLGSATARHFALRVATVDLDVLVETSGLEEPAFRISPQDLAAVPTGGTILWQVEATLADGEVVTSPTFVQRLE